MFDWQTIIAGSLVVAAAIYLLRRIRNLFAGGTRGCGGGASSCATCPSARRPGHSAGVEFVDLQVDVREQ